MSTKTNDDELHDVEGAGAILLFLILMAAGIASSALSGFVISRLWAWFVAPLGIAQIGVVQAMGLSLVVYMLTMGIPRREVDSKTWYGRMLGSLSFHTVGALLTWGFGALYHAFM